MCRKLVKSITKLDKFTIIKVQSVIDLIDYNFKQKNQKIKIYNIQKKYTKNK